MSLDPEVILSTRGKTALPDGIRGLFPLEKPGVVSFLAGKPNPQTFPFQSLTLHLKAPLGSDKKEGSVSLELEGDDMIEALQYGPTAGLPRLTSWLTEFTSQIHSRSIPPPLAAAAPVVARPRAVSGNFGEGVATPPVRTQEEVVPLSDELKGLEGGKVEEVRWRVSVGNGCQDLMNKCFQSVLNPGDPILVETPGYAGALSQFQSLQLSMIEVEVDDSGLSATGLERTLAEWPTDGSKGKRPTVLYTVPVACNPSGCSHPVERRLEVLKVCVKYGVLIVEDDPYYFLATDLIPSYFQLETQIAPAGGYVIRFDSMSKLLSAGMRMGFATGPTYILNAMDANTSAANLQPNSLAMAVVYRLLRYWGIEGFRDHGRRVAEFYKGRRDQFEAIAKKHLEGIAKWNSPVAGMFLWIDISPITDSFDLVMNEALSKGVLAVPGFAFYPLGRQSSHLRVSFSIVDMEAAERGFAALAAAIRERRAVMGVDA